MRVLEGAAWRADVPDYTPEAGDVALTVRRWLTIAPVEGLYFVRASSPRMVLNYLRELGPREVWRKVRSRRAEHARNAKFVSVGIGLASDSAVYLFVAPAHPQAVDAIALSASAVRRLDVAAPADLRTARWTESCPSALAAVAGWSSHSGEIASSALWSEALDAAHELIFSADWDTVPAIAPASEPPPAAGPVSGRGVLYGYGNYAKLYVVPNVDARIPIDLICEIDPLQIPADRLAVPRWSTRARPHPDDRFDAWFIAGYHHGHAEIAAQALMQGAVAVVEKPLAVDQGQLDSVLDALDSGAGGRLFAGYHKRHSVLTALALNDLAAAPGAPIDYHCTVYEVPLPPRHWYRWPNSHSRIVSNGCHWLDHFLYVNGYAAPQEIEVTAARSGTIDCNVELANGAFFTMALTEHGSERLGVRDHIELRHGPVTVTIDDGSRYRAESSERVIRTRRVNKTTGYSAMYRSIAEAIVTGGPGDSRSSIATGGQLIIDVETRLRVRYGIAAA